MIRKLTIIITLLFLGIGVYASDHLQAAFDDVRRAHAIPLHGMIGSKFLMSNNIILDFNNMIAYNKNK